MKTITNEELKFLIKPLTFLLLIIILAVVVLSIGSNQIQNVISKNNETQNNEILLKQKIATLESVSELVSGDINFLDVVLPSKSAVLYGISQIKNEAARNNLLVTNIKTGSPELLGGGVYSSTINFDIEGSQASVYNFFNSFSKILPLMSIKKMRITESLSVTKVAAMLGVYSSDLPKNIPSLSTSVNTLTTDEITLLKELSTYSLPIFVESDDLTTPGREDPFN